MTVYQAPAKLNFSLLVSPPRADGYHPLESLVHTIEWCDLLDVRAGEGGGDALQSDIEDNLISRALAELRKSARVPPLTITLTKEIPVAAGLGGGSSDAAAALVAGADFGDVTRSELPELAMRVGADVALFLTGGTMIIRDAGHDVESRRPLGEFAVAVVVPEFGLSTKEVYEHWDALEGPEGPATPDDVLPPSLRGGMPMRNDLLPAAVDVEPRLGDFMADVSSVWGTVVGLTGSGSACFGYFATLDEATDAAAAVAVIAAESRGVELRPSGVVRVENRMD